MADGDRPQTFGETSPPPVEFRELEDLCRLLDDWYVHSGIQCRVPPSVFIKGALYAMRYKDNPDWMAQVAHSLREILYQFGESSESWGKAMQAYGSAYRTNRISPDVGPYYNFITEIAHHRFDKAETKPLIGGSKDQPVTITDEMFEGVVLRFGRLLQRVLQRQTEIHKLIDDVLSEDPS